MFVEIDESFNIDPAEIEAKITPRTKAIIAVHLQGHTADLDPILEIAHQHNLIVIEDACQAHGAKYKGKRTGSLGDAAAFSSSHSTAMESRLSIRAYSRRCPKSICPAR